MQRPHHPLYYADYLQLERLLSSQAPKSWEHDKPAHDEMLFIVEQLRILETMTPLDFLEFRDWLTPASGFQSFQFRLIENKLGLKPELRQAYDKSAYYSRLSPAHQEMIRQAESSLFFLIPRSALPELPPDFEKNLGFYYEQKT